MHARNAHYSARYAHADRPAPPPRPAWMDYPAMVESASYTNAEAADIVQRLADRLSDTRAGTHIADKCLVDQGRDLAKELLAWA